MLSTLQYWTLKRFFPRVPDCERPSAELQPSRLRLLIGEKWFESLQGKVVVDFGCGEGTDSIELARSGIARRVIGVDIRDDVLAVARMRAGASAIDDSICTFTTSTAHADVDTVVSVDAFEHFSDPAGVLRTMYGILRPGGEVLISFGWPWFHPMGGHLFSVFPWAHLLFTERALIRWRSDFKTDGATRFGEVAGGLNQMTIRRFERLVDASGFSIAALECVPIRPLRLLHNRWTREFTTAIVRCRLVKPI